jgi:hypothetical protein
VECRAGDAVVVVAAKAALGVDRGASALTFRQSGESSRMYRDSILRVASSGALAPRARRELLTAEAGVLRAE